ncbi:MAG: hypothetical protein PHF06_03315, partial [Sphaerochaeta sp.]|uniref:hypothetical protein n=1 Tax=Sphaerochaeta sp. TaxID=1972642 RepID=UPI00258B41F9
ALLVITGCNADASAGLFRQLANSREIVDVRYNQLLGQNPASNLYFLTDKGIYATAGETTSISLKIANETDRLIRTAYYDKNDTILYTINAEPTKVQKYTISTGVLANPSLTPTNLAITTLLSAKVIPNGLIMLTGTSSTGETKYALVDSAFAEVSDLSAQSLDGYSLVGVWQITGSGSTSITTSPLVVSFVNTAEEYKHFYLAAGGANAQVLNIADTHRIVNFFMDGANIYLLTSNGRIFKGTSGGSFTEIVDVSETYPDHAFGYLAGTSPTLYYITKPNNKDQLTVFTINATTNAVTTTAVTKGYAKLIYNTEIVDALELTSGDLLVATARNGMYKITITTPNSNEDTNGSSSEAEKYFP